MITLAPGDLRLVLRFGTHLDRVVSMFARFAPARDDGSIGWSGRKPADVEGRPVRGNPTGLPQPRTTGPMAQPSSNPPSMIECTDIGKVGCSR
jgi:hypothetical protein